MGDVAVVCTDGSELAIEAAKAGLAVLRDDATIIVVTVAQEEDFSLVAGTGIAGGVMTQEEFDALNRQIAAESRSNLERTLGALGLNGARSEVLRGGAGPAICAFAEQVEAKVIVMGSHGRGGFKRALLGSVSDYVVRHAPSSVLVTNAKAAD
jgi:nucleotide-binding universal stress UspA family protein